MRNLLLFIFSPLCSAIPTVLLNSGKPHCVSLDAEQDTVIRVQYEAPDLILDVNDPNYGAAYVTINVKPSGRVFETDLHMAPIRDRLKPKSELIRETEGEIVHKFEVDGTANICIRAAKASGKKPMAFALGIRSDEEDPAIDVPGEEEPVKTADVNMHLGHMERELRRITSAMDHVLREADKNKDQDALFHEQTMAMNAATTFWPIVQVCVLLITGFTQASHIVRFFKSRRII